MYPLFRFHRRRAIRASPNILPQATCQATRRVLPSGARMFYHALNMLLFSIFMLKWQFPLFRHKEALNQDIYLNLFLWIFEK